jgi:hypothetical protein
MILTHGMFATNAATISLEKPNSPIKKRLNGVQMIERLSKEQDLY